MHTIEKRNGGTKKLSNTTVSTILLDEWTIHKRKTIFEFKSWKELEIRKEMLRSRERMNLNRIRRWAWSIWRTFLDGEIGQNRTIFLKMSIEHIQKLADNLDELLFTSKIWEFLFDFEGAGKQNVIPGMA